MLNYYKTYSGDVELDYFSKEHFIFNKTPKFSKKCASSGVIMLDKKNQTYVPFQILCNKWDCEDCSSKKSEILKSKLNIIAPKEDFSFFLTLTIQPINLFKRDKITQNISKNLKNLSQIVENGQKTLEISLLFKKLKSIFTEYDKTLDINKIKSRYKYKTLIQAQEKKKSILNNWFEYELETQIKKIVRTDSIILNAKKYNIYFKKLDSDKQQDFLNKYKFQIDAIYNKNYEQKKNELLNNQNFINSKKEWFNEVMSRNQDKERAYFLVIEFTKNKHPHFHILLNKYIPTYLIEKYDNTSSKIYKNLDLKENIESNDYFYKKSVNYVLKYFFKSFENENSTYSILQNLNKNFNLYKFSSNLYKKYPFLKTKNPSEERRFEVIDNFEGQIKNTNLIFNPNIYTSSLEKELAFKEYKKNLTTNLTHEKYSKLEKDYENAILNFKSQLPNKLQNQLKQNILSTQLLQTQITKQTNEDFPFFSPPGQEKKENLNGLDQYQLQTLKSIFENKITLCIGDAGSGKTTILKTLNELYQNKYKITYSSLTAQSCVNINKKLNLTDNQKQAKTIHKTFNNIFSKNHIKFKVNENNLLDTEILVIDEFTMLDKEIFFNILKGILIKTHILLLGDEKQLSNFKSNSLYYELKKLNFSIIKLEGQYRSNSLVLSKINQFFNFEDIESKYEDNTLDLVTSVILINKNFKILCNTNNLVRQINQLCLEKDSKNRNIKTLAQNEFKIGDIVMNTKNNYLLDGLANGENLTILTFNFENQSLLVERHINNQILEIPFEDTFYLVPAYAITIHKSQGSEYDEGFIFIENTKGNQLCNQNIVYTACSRFKNDFKLYFIDIKAKNKSYHNNLSSFNTDLFEFQKPKELLTELNKELVSNSKLIHYSPAQIRTGVQGSKVLDDSPLHYGTVNLLI